jgi:hypothetical protein
MPPMQTYLTSRNSSIPFFFARVGRQMGPMPLSFMPPKGAISPVDLAEMMPSLMPTMQYSRASATRQMRPISRL